MKRDHHRYNRLSRHSTSHIHPITLILKWIFDKSIAIIGLLITVLLIPFIAIAIKCDSRGPIFFKQLRVGRAWPTHTELFYIVKFRTMKCHLPERSKINWTQRDDPRVTRVGRFLRVTRLDELPQFYNVLVGDMSLIGPRPERPEFYHHLESAIPFYAERLYGIAPGITGLAQVNLGYDENIEDVRKKVAFDHAYTLSLTKPITWFFTEIMIIFKTIKVVLYKLGQ